MAEEIKPIPAKPKKPSPSQQEGEKVLVGAAK